MREFCENFLIFPCVRCPLIGRPLVSSSSSRTNGRKRLTLSALIYGKRGKFVGAKVLHFFTLFSPHWQVLAVWYSIFAAFYKKTRKIGALSRPSRFPRLGASSLDLFFYFPDFKSVPIYLRFANFVSSRWNREWWRSYHGKFAHPTLVGWTINSSKGIEDIVG